MTNSRIQISHSAERLTSHRVRMARWHRDWTRSTTNQPAGSPGLLRKGSRRRCANPTGSELTKPSFKTLKSPANSGRSHPTHITKKVDERDESLSIIYLAKVRPMDKPSNTKLWDEAKGWLDITLQLGHSHDWKKDIGVKAAEPEFWEALRIVRDSEHGYGSFSTTDREPHL